MEEPPKKKKRSVQDTPIDPPHRILENILDIKRPDMQSLAAFLYLTGARISEVLGQRNKMIMRAVTKEIYKVKPLAVSQIEIGEDRITVYGIPTLKRRARKVRNVPIRIHHGDAEFVDIVRNYLVPKQEDEIAWTFSRQYFERYIKKTPYHPHWFRSARATLLSTHYNLDAIQIQKFFDWASLEQAARYAQLNVRDIERKMDESNRNN